MSCATGAAWRSGGGRRVGGMVVPIAIYLAINAGHSSVSGWGAAMSTDTAFALGMLALVGRRFPAACAPSS